MATLASAGCRTGTNFTDASGPRYSGGTPAPPRGPVDTLRIASFNIENAQEIDSALAVFAAEPALRRADVVLLQEMNEAGTARLARALGMTWVYYPAITRRQTGRHFGEAVLSRWPIVEDHKVILPHRAIFGGTQRIATAVTLQVGPTRVRVYSVHLATPVNMALRQRRDQMRAVLADASPAPYVVVGGDLNSGDMADLALAQGYRWATRTGPRTVLFGRWDHIFLRGFRAAASGTVTDTRHASDHRPVWTVAVLDRRWWEREASGGGGGGAGLGR